MRVHNVTEWQALAFIAEDGGHEIKVRIRTGRRATCSVHGHGRHDHCEHTQALANHQHDSTTKGHHHD